MQFILNILICKWFTLHEKYPRQKNLTNQYPRFCLILGTYPGEVVEQILGRYVRAAQVFKRRVSGTDFFGLKQGSWEQIFFKICVLGAKM